MIPVSIILLALVVILVARDVARTRTHRRLEQKVTHLFDAVIDAQVLPSNTIDRLKLNILKDR